MFVGITGWLCDPTRGKELRDAVKYIPLDRILIETDSPYLAPTPFRGKRNESKYIINIAEKIAEIHNISIIDVAKKTTFNALKLFNL